MNYHVETIEYKGYNIEVYQDDRFENPFVDWDCEIDVIMYNCDGIDYFGYTDPEYLPELTKQEIIDNLDQIKYLLDFKPEYSLIRALKYYDGYSIGYYSHNNAVEWVNSVLNDAYQGEYNSNKLNFLESVLNMKGIITLSDTATGYSQSHWCDYLLVASPEFLKYTGANITDPSQLKGSADLFEAWHNGDIFCFVVKDPDQDDDLSNVIDSCGGFYGTNHRDSGLLETAESAIDYEIHSKLQSKLEHTKIMIKNNVPLSYR